MYDFGSKELNFMVYGIFLFLDIGVNYGVIDIFVDVVVGYKDKFIFVMMVKRYFDIMEVVGC